MASAENTVVKSVLDYLRLAQKTFNILFYRSNNIATRGRTFAPGSMRGVPDITVVHQGQYVGIECKAPKEKLSEDQMLFRDRCVNAGGRYVTAKSLHDVQDIFFRQPITVDKILDRLIEDSHELEKLMAMHTKDVFAQDVFAQGKRAYCLGMIEFLTARRNG